MMNKQNKPVLGVSSCLMGNNVRFDGGHKHCRLLTDQWAGFFDYIPTCPEADIGLGIPRPVIQLRETNNETKLVFSRNPSHDLTQRMNDYSLRRIHEIGVLDGYIFKKDSPTCGVERVAVAHESTGQKTRDGMGLFAKKFQEMNPLVPIEEEGRLNDPVIRDNFLERIYCHYRWRNIPDAENNYHGFIDFHKRHKFMLMARNHQAYRELGRLAASANKTNLNAVRQEYIQRFMDVMVLRPSRGQHVNVLLHILGYFKRNLNGHDKSELINWFDAYHSSKVSRITPVAFIRHYLRIYPDNYIAEQYYLAPYPDDLFHTV